MGNDTYLGNSDVIKKLDDLSTAVGGTSVPTTTTKTNTDFVIGINKSIDAASGRTGVEYPPYSHNTLVTGKLDELAEAIAEGGGGGPGPTPVMGALSVTENGDYLPSSYNYDGFSSVSVDVPEPPSPVMGTLSVTENGDYLPSSYNYDGFSSVSVDVPEPTPTETTPMIGSNGAQRLTLPYYADDGISIEFKMMLSSNSSNRVIFGDLFDYDGTVLYTVNTNAALGARTQREWYSENLPYKSWNIVDVKLDIANGIFTIDGVDYGTGHVPTTHPANYYLTLFDIYGGGRGASVAIGEVSIKQNDVEVMHLVPMKNSQTGAGYYHDSIGDQDYYSEGSKDFIYTEFSDAPNVVKVLDDGEISTESAYVTANFEDISGYEYVLVRFRDTVSSVDYVDYRYVKVSDIGSGVTLYPYLHRQIQVSLTTTSISALQYSGSYYNIYADIVGLDEDIFEIDYIKPIPISSVRAPELLSAQSANKGSLVSLSYTFTSAGTYQFYVMDRTWLEDHYEFMTTVKLNGVEITSTEYIDPANGDVGYKYGEITVNANDVLTVTTTQTLENYCVNLWIFRYADINSFRHIGFRGNDGSTFTINSAGVVFAEAYCTGYYNGRNNFNYLVGVGYNGLNSIPTPNTSDHYYGFTYVFSLTGGNS